MAIHHDADAIRQVRPYGVDLCTGVRSEERLAPDKLAEFFAEVDRAGTA